MQTERRVAANPQTKPTDLDCESAERLAATIRRHHRHLLLNVIDTSEHLLWWTQWTNVQSSNPDPEYHDLRQRKKTSM